ncbi:MAG: restriction endonuclease subunit S, partial [Lewinellaceae bacterium]|nr:restriction endonuclease subunit S [Lewinellaceae bacterium]
PVFFPNLEEQKAIATFLDHKTAQIAHYIQFKEKTIALLEERKAAIINQAVTRGLDADVKMKDSGIEWLGEVPEGWEVKKLWYLISYITSGSRGWGNYYSEKGAVFIRVGNISKNKDISLNLEDLIFVSPPSSSEGKRTLIVLNDVLLAITGATIGSVALIDKDLGEAYVNQHTALMRPIKEKINPKWLAYSLLSEYCQTQIRLKSYGGTKEGLGLNEVRTFKILLPPLWVQDSIIHEIDDKIHEINNHISCVSKEITLIKEYRESLISAAVTGKIDVREYQPTDNEYAAADNH